MKNSVRLLCAVLTVTTLASCVESPNEPLADVDQTPLATSFDALADEMHTTDIERSEELRWAALAVRAGVRPSVLNVTNNGVTEIYDAFVHGVSWVSTAEAMRPPTHRNLVAWRRTGTTLQVIVVGLATDSARVLHPFSMRPNAPGGAPSSPLLGAKAAYFERSNGSGTSWVGIGGAAKIYEKVAGGPCGDGEHVPVGVACQLTHYGVQLTVHLAETPTRDSRDVPANPVTRWIIAAEQTVAGAKLVFSCETPSPGGCQ